MVDGPVYEIDPTGSFKKALIEASRQVEDLTIPYISITKSWYQGNKAIFSLQGPGKWQDYKKNKKGFSAYARKKARQFGSPYPMLVHYGLLRQSLTDGSDADAINQIVNKKTLLLGTSIKYGPFLQLGTKYMVARPFMFIGGESTAPPELNARVAAWTNIIRDYVRDVTKNVGNWQQ